MAGIGVRFGRSDARLVNAVEAQTAQDAVRKQACHDGSCRYEYSYPFLLQARNGDFHVVYTWNRAFIKHVHFTPAWLAQRLEQIK